MSGEVECNVVPTTKKVGHTSTGITESEPKPEINILICRHGERVDFLYSNDEYPLWMIKWVDECFYGGKYVRYDLNMPVELPRRNGFPNSFIGDTPLTNVGVLQAKETGVGFAEASVAVKYVYCSPALRCVQTCHNILTGMGISDDVAIRIEPALFEHLPWRPEHFPSFMSDDELIAAGYNIDKTYVPAVSRDDSKKLLIETCLNYYQRSYDIVKRFIATAEQQGGGNILIVAHGFSLDSCTRQLTGRKPLTRDELYELFESNIVPYCSVVRCQKEKRRWKLRESPAPGLKIQENKRFNFEFLLL